MKFEIVPSYDVPIAEQARVFTEAFAGYVAGSFQFNPTTLATFLSAQGIDLCYSRFVRDGDGRLISFGFINRTSDISRLGAMGTIAAGRRSGAGRFLVSHLLQEAQNRGDRQMFLEVFEQNPAAIALYEAHGFKSVVRLHGWRSSTTNPESETDTIQEISMTEALQLPHGVDYPEIPWQISRHAMAKVARPRVFRYGDIAAIIGEPKTSPARFYGYLGFTGRNWDELRQLTQSLVGKFSGTQFFAPQIFPEEFGLKIFAPLNFQKEPLNQFLMRKDL